MTLIPLCTLCLCIFLETGANNEYEDLDVSALNLIKNHGYPVELYSDVRTEDNYLLDIYRIPHGKVKKKRFGNPVLLASGTFRTCRDFIIMGPRDGLAYLLADKGYDVWMANFRGTTYSRKHSTLDPDKHPEYWKFSWHEIGLYDLPATFELIRNVTKKERFSYVGVSQGATVYFVLTTMKPEYNLNITVMIALAPQVYMQNFPNMPLQAAAIIEPIWRTITNGIGLSEFPPIHLLHVMQLFMKVISRTKNGVHFLLLHFYLLICGYDLDRLGERRFEYYRNIYHTLISISSGCATRELLHFAQNINTGLFRAYDLGPKENLRKYGTTEAPFYNLTKTTVPTALFYSADDWVVHPSDVNTLCTTIPNCIDLYKVPQEQWAHFDFLIEQDVVKFMFKPLFRILNKYNNKKRFIGTDLN